MNLTLDGERVRLRPLCDDDVALSIELFTDPRVMTYICETATPEQILLEAPLAMRRGGGGCIGVWNVSLRQTAEGLGEAFLLPLPINTDDTEWDLVGGPDLPDADIEIGYFFKPSAWGLGYATEAARLLLNFAFEHTTLNNVVAVIDPQNSGSRNVLLKAGFNEAGPRRAYATEMLGFRITRDSWRARHSMTARG
jgi:RimJ/RimL family protein N-acetyltransferase